MSLQSNQLRAAQSVVAQFARDVLDNRIEIHGRQVPPGEWLEPVQQANRFYADRLTPTDDSYGIIQTHQLGPDTGSAILVVAYNIEGAWGAVEIYSPTGSLQAAGVHIAAGVAWLPVEVVRQAMLGRVAPRSLMPKPTTLEWVLIGPNACWSVGGRFEVLPDPTPPHQRTVLHDLVNQTQHPCDSLAGAQALAAALLDNAERPGRLAQGFSASWLA
jgi:hypothetical protein